MPSMASPVSMAGQQSIHRRSDNSWLRHLLVAQAVASVSQANASYASSYVYWTLSHCKMLHMAKHAHASCFTRYTLAGGEY